ncbi:MAG: hypothetical protein ACRDRP_07750 [Pseudonocardiaceae bacterium]
MHAGLPARALFDLAILGRDPGEATDRLTTAAAGHTVGHIRPRAVDLTKLASLTMATGDPIQAATMGSAALDIAGTIHSTRDRVRHGRTGSAAARCCSGC